MTSAHGHETAGRQPAALVLADGDVLEGEAAGATPPGGIATGELVFNTVDVRLPGGAHRPELRGSGDLLHLPPHRQLRGDAGGHEARRAFWQGIRRARPAAETLELAVERVARGHARDRGFRGSPVSTRGASLARCGRTARSLARSGPPRSPSSQEAARPSRGRRGWTSLSEVSTNEPYVAGIGSSPRGRIRLRGEDDDARCLAEIATVTVVPSGHSGIRCTRARARRGLPVERTGGPGGTRGRRPRRLGSAREGADLRDLSRPSTARDRARGGDLQARVRSSRR